MFKMNSWTKKDNYYNPKNFKKFMNASNINAVSTACGSEVDTACGSEVFAACGSEVDTACGSEVFAACGSEVNL
ncbi:hypothetical protein [Methanobrevibacter boviskoreani]|uniref:hypothetical protein n=1 Tax=Methanobrevibacter boviskoreani TaxID=1348249 RepID=UPI0005948C67|nr:hypothetical protein [Methanobrevibacter boviskoreani]